MKEKIYKKIKVSDLVFMENNPRYTFGDKSHKFKDIAEESQNLENSITNLLESEEDLEKLLNLIKNFSEIGFDISEDVPPFAIKSNFYKEKYIVIEGNRRLLCLKLLSKNIDVLNIFNKYEYNINELYKEDYKDKIEFDKNKKKIIEVIENQDNKIDDNTLIPINFFDIERTSDSDYILLEKKMISRIISRHTYSESSFKKEWTRVIMFFELRLRFIDILKEELSKSNNYKNSLDNTYEELKNIYKRKLSTIKTDVFTSFYVFNIVNNWAEQQKNKESAIKKIKSSAIELSLSKIKNYDGITLRRRISIKRKDSINDEFINDNFNLLKIGIESIDWEFLSSFVMMAYLGGNLNTRRFTICNKKKKNNEIISMMSKIFDSPIEQIEKIPCDPENRFEYQEIYLNMFEENKFIRDIIRIKNYKKDELSEQTKKEIFDKIIKKSNEISLYIINNPQMQRKDIIVGVYDALIRKNNIWIKNKFKENSKNKFEKFGKNLNDLNPIEKSIFMSIKKIINYDLENINNSYGGAIDNLDSLSNLSILVRSLIEMSFVMSGYFYKDKYEKDEKESNLILNPRKIFLYKNKDYFSDDYSILDFSLSKPIHSFKNLTEEWNKYKSYSKGNLPAAIESTQLNEVYMYYLNNKDIYNKIIHRYWSIPSKDILITLNRTKKNTEANTKFYESFPSINNYINESFKIIDKQIELFIEWINSNR